MVDRTFDYVGKSVPRTDGWDKATGRGLFTHDVVLPRMLYAKVLRSPYAHAKIVSVDASAAEALPGVKVVAHCKNTPRTFFNTAAPMVLTLRPLMPVLDQQVFPDVVRYIGDEVAAVAATSEKIAEKALKLIKVEYEEIPAVFDPLEAMKEDSPLVHPETPNEEGGHNVTGEPVILNVGDVEKGFAEGEVFADITMKLPRQKQVQLETHAAVASYTYDNRLTIYSTTQAPHPSKMIVSRALGIPESRISLKNPPYVGGGFGVRIGISGKAEVLAATLSKMCGLPVKFVYTREEDFVCSDTRHGGYVHGRMAAKKDGTIVALEVESRLNAGAYSTFSCEVEGLVGIAGTGAYRIPNLHFDGRSVYTNQTTAGAMRGYGTPQGTVLTETLLDDIAKQIGMDPAEIRLKNTVKSGDKWLFPYPVGSTGLNECIRKTAESIGWKEKRGKPKSGTIRRGVGIAAGTHVSNAWPFCLDYDSIQMRLDGDGSLHVTSGIPEIGPGSTTACMQIACDVIGVNFEKSYMNFGDSDAGTFEIGSHATRTLYAVGNVIVKAGTELKKDVLDWAAEFLKADRCKLDMHLGVISDGAGKSITIEELCYEAHLAGKRFQILKCETPPNSPPWQSNAVEVEVDTETGMVKVVKIAAAHDVGRVVNPALCESQIEGAIMQGIGYAIREEMTYIDGKGFYNEGIHKYMLATADDIPEMDTILVESNDPAGPFGVKGIGETGLICTAPAILSAVEDAIGIRFYEFPLTPGRVLEGINEARKNGANI